MNRFTSGSLFKRHPVQLTTLALMTSFFFSGSSALIIRNKPINRTLISARALRSMTGRLFCLEGNEFHEMKKNEK